MRQRVVLVLFLVGAGGCTAWALSVAEGPLDVLPAVVLAACAVAANVADARWSPHLSLSGSLIAGLVAAAFLGPAPAFAVVALAEVVGWVVERFRLAILPMNVLGLGVPVLATGVLLPALVPDGALAGVTFYLVLAAVIALASGLNLLIVASGLILYDGGPAAEFLRAQRRLLPVWALNIAVTVVVASMYVAVGVSAIVLLALGLAAFTYQSRLVAKADDRSRRYRSLSWGVLSGMVRSLDMRDRRTARHSAAVARFARDIAAAVDLPAEDRELAHIAGLLHDVGKFALSDRALEHGIKLNDEDWKGIRRHPELGADMLKDLGVYGPVADVVRSHHERLDGRGYPSGLEADAIPEIAKIVAVAEIYDTLTAGDTYRAPVSSFEALRELRRVTGRQLEGRYVEALATVLAGTGVAYRHAEDADFDTELELERRVEAALDGQGARG